MQLLQLVTCLTIYSYFIFASFYFIRLNFQLLKVSHLFLRSYYKFRNTIELVHSPTIALQWLFSQRNSSRIDTAGRIASSTPAAFAKCIRNRLAPGIRKQNIRSLTARYVLSYPSIWTGHNRSLANSLHAH